MPPTSIVTAASPNNVIKGMVVSTLTVGQVPQTGLLSSINNESVLKSSGSEVIFVTHQLDIS